MRFGALVGALVLLAGCRPAETSTINPPPVVTTGGLTVVVAGLPGSLGAITVTGPSGYSQSPSATVTLSGLVPGTYTVAAANVTNAGTTYAPSLTTQTITVGAGATATATVTYTAVVTPPGPPPPAPTTGSLALTVTGLPASVNGNVSVTAPGGFALALTGTQTVNTLAVGTYTVSALNVQNGNTPYVPTVATQPAIIVAGGTTPITVTYSAAAPQQYTALPSGFQTRSMVVDGVTRGYQIYIPPGYNPAVPQRVILFCHGSGENGSSNFHQITVGLGRYISDNGNTFPDVVVFAQVPTGLGDDAAGAVAVYHIYKTALDRTIAEVNTDLTRVLVTGISSGATFTWMMAYQEPTRYAAFAPIAQWLVGKRMLQNDAASNGDGRTAATARFPNFPIHTYFGSLDAPSTGTSMQADADAFNAVPNPKFLHTIVAGADHGASWDLTYASAAFWTWFRAQHR